MVDKRPKEPEDDVDWTILEALGAHPRDLVSHVAAASGLTRQAVHKRVSKLVDEGWIVARGATRARTYLWKPALQVPVSAGLSEDQVWRNHVAPRLETVPPKARAILEYGTLEMINNVIDHSGASEMVVVVRPTRDDIEVYIEDDGVGIFRKLTQDLHLADVRTAMLELSKGKLTTDPDNHTGEGIFFTCRMCDQFLIWSRDQALTRIEGAGLRIGDAPNDRSGTTVRLSVRRDTERTPREVFDAFAAQDEDFDFSRTVVAVQLARYEGESLFSRSQARRLMARCDRFRDVVLDFSGVESIGPAFADEIFRVFARAHPDVHLTVQEAGVLVQDMIDKARRKAIEGP